MQEINCLPESVPEIREEEVLPGIPWGRPEWVLSPRYWATLAAILTPPLTLFAQSETLVEEVGFCLLGGFGINAETNCAAHARMQEHGVYSGRLTASRIEALLMVPLDVNGRSVRYRFPRQRSARLSHAVRRLSEDNVPSHDALLLRKYLLSIGGIGPKTASWITRNWLGSDEVAIIDIHVERACRAIGLFGPDLSVQRDYFLMEAKFLSLAAALGVAAGRLDAIMWSEMRKLGTLGIEAGEPREQSDGKWRRRRRRGGIRRGPQTAPLETAASTVY